MSSFRIGSVIYSSSLWQSCRLCCSVKQNHSSLLPSWLVSALVCSLVAVRKYQDMKHLEEDRVYADQCPTDMRTAILGANSSGGKIGHLSI